MKEKLAGIIAVAEFHEIRVLPRFAKKFSDSPVFPGLLLKPEKEWAESIVVGGNVKLVLVNGEAYQTKVTGFRMGERPASVFVSEIPDVMAESLVGASLYVFTK